MWWRFQCLNNHLDVFIQTYKLGDPAVPETNLGPVVSVASAERIRKQIADAGMSRFLYASLLDHSHSSCGRESLNS